MKRIIPLGFTLLLLAIQISGCTSTNSTQISSSLSPSPIPSQTKSILEQEPTPELTATATPTRAAPTPIPTRPVGPPPQPEAVISSENADQVEELIRIGSGSAGQVAFSPSGDYLAVATTTGVQLYDSTTLAFVREYPSQSFLQSLAFSPDGQMLTAGSLSDYVVQIWDVASGNEIHTLSGHTDRVWSVDFSPDGEKLVSGGEDAVILWDIATGRELLSIPAEPDREILDAAFSPDGRTIAYAIASTVQGMPDNRVILWNVVTRRFISELGKHENRITDLSFSPDGKTLASSATDKTVKLWDVYSRREIITLTEESEVYSLAFSPDGKTLAYGLSEPLLILWDTTTQQTKQVLPWNASYIDGIEFSPNGKNLAAKSYDLIALYGLSTDELHSLRYIYFGSAAISPDGKTAATAGRDSISLWDITMGDELHGLEHPGNVLSMAFSPDGKTIASGASGGESDKLIRIWDVATGEILHTLSVLTNNVQSVTFSQDGIWLAAEAWNGRAKLWNAVTGEEERVFTSPLQLVDVYPFVKSLAFSPDDKLLAAGLSDTRIAVWDVATGNEVFVLGKSEYTAGVKSVVFSPDGKILASGSPGSGQYPSQGPVGIRLWEVATGQQLALGGLSSSGVMSLAFSPDGNLLAAGMVDGTIKLIDIAWREELADLKGHATAVTSLAFSADGSVLISSSTDQTARIWGIAPAQAETASLPFRLAPPQPMAPTQMSKSKFPICNTVSEIPFKECEALVAIYFSTDGENWSNQDGWLESNTPCSWYGITCKAQHVTWIKLNNNGLTGKLPPEISGLTSLIGLKATNNNLESLPVELFNLPYLQRLHLAENHLSSLAPEIGNLTQLTELILSNNNLTELPLEISQLTNLSRLNLEANDFSALPPELCSVFAEIVIPQELCSSVSIPPTVAVTLTPTPAPILDPSCSSVLPPRLVVGEGAAVDDQTNTPNRLRVEPGLSAQHVSYALPGAELDVLDGPVCADGMWWWRVLVIETQMVGWTVEGDAQEYWLIPDE